MLRVVEPDSLLVRGLADNASRGLSPALDRSTTFENPPGGSSPYGRGHAPVAREAEALLGALEDAEAAVFASGMTAWTCICLAVLGEGEALALPTSGYYSLEGFSAEILERFGVEIRRYDARDRSDFRRACEGAALAIIETPSNPLLTLTDIAQAASDAHAGGALLCCDSTFATPLLQRPLDLGADLSWQSATKYLAGHSDVLAGVVTTRDSRLHERIVNVRRSIGGVLAPDAAWLLLRGLRTLHVRVPRQVASAGELARRLARHPDVVAVHYPGLPSTPTTSSHGGRCPRAAAACWPSSSRTALAAGRCEDGVRLARCATSLGGFETLIERRARTEPEGRVPEGLLRLAVGLEDVDDLWADLTQAIASAVRRPVRPQRFVGAPPPRRGCALAQGVECFRTWSTTRYSSVGSSTTRRVASPPRSTARRRSSACPEGPRPTGADTRRSPQRPRRSWAASRMPRRRCSRAA